MPQGAAAHPEVDGLITDLLISIVSILFVAWKLTTVAPVSYDSVLK